MRYPTPDQVDADAVAATAKALAHPARIQILELLAGQSQCRGADVFAELPLAQSTVSQHLKVLRDAGIVSVARRGTSMVYCLRNGALDDFAGSVARLSGMIAVDSCGSDDSGEGACA